MSDWLKETYDNSFDKCEEIDPAMLHLLAEGFAHFNGVYDAGPTDPAILLEQFKDPFLSNVKEVDKEVFLQAARESGITVEFGPAKCGMESHGYVGLYCPHKGKYDLGRFWARVDALRPPRDP